MCTIRNLWNKTKIVFEFLRWLFSILRLLCIGLATFFIAVLWFLWRHFVTLWISGVVWGAFMEGSINWKHAFFWVGGAIFFDWAKLHTGRCPCCYHYYCNDRPRIY